jgi:hypothetical protein
LFLLIASAFVFVVVVALKEMGVEFMGASPPPINQWAVGLQAVLVGLMYYSLTLMGIAAGVISDALAGMKEGTPVSWGEVRGYLRSAQSWRGLVASPLIFLTVYMGVRSNPIGVPFILLAFQNGFFWKSALSRLAQNH